MLLRCDKTGPEVLYVLRSEHEGDPWSGNIGFPGGHIENDDPSPQQTAERETCEEIGLDLSQGEYLGRLDDVFGAHLPVVVACYAYHLPTTAPFTLSDEIAQTFWMPLHELVDPQRQTQIEVDFRGERLVRPALDLLGPGRTRLWGITYRMTTQFLALFGHALPATSIP